MLCAVWPCHFSESVVPLHESHGLLNLVIIHRRILLRSSEMLLDFKKLLGGFAEIENCAASLRKQTNVMT